MYEYFVYLNTHLSKKISTLKKIIHIYIYICTSTKAGLQTQSSLIISCVTFYYVLLHKLIHLLINSTQLWLQYEWVVG